MAKLIDADALQKHIREKALTPESAVDYSTVLDVLEWIDEMPTVDAQKPRMLDIGGILTVHQIDVYLEDRSDKRVFPITLLDTENTNKSQTAYFFPMMVRPIKSYGKTWRCWTSRPTDEQREATPWQ